MRVEPIDADQKIELVGQARDRVVGDPYQGGGLAAANLRSDRAGQQPLPTGQARRFQQEIRNNFV